MYFWLLHYIKVFRERRMAQQELRERSTEW